MDNLEKWEVLRLGAYNLAMLGVLFFLVGTILEGSILGIDEPTQSLLALIGDTFHNVGEAAGIIGGALAYWTGG